MALRRNSRYIVAMANRAIAPGARMKVPSQVEKSVLVLSRRRCCLCFGLAGDLGQKSGQIAHLDRNRTNNSIDNLAFLCLPHHDEYDSVTSQRKGLQRAEVSHYRDTLYELIDRADQSSVLALLRNESGTGPATTVRDGPSQKELEATSSRELLTRLLSAAQAWYDEIIAHLCALQLSPDTRGRYRLGFEYVWSRSHLPVMVAVTDVLTERPTMATIVREAKGFLEILTTQSASQDAYG